MKELRKELRKVATDWRVWMMLVIGFAVLQITHSLEWYFLWRWTAAVAAVLAWGWLTDLNKVEE